MYFLFFSFLAVITCEDGSIDSSFLFLGEGEAVVIVEQAMEADGEDRNLLIGGCDRWGGEALRFAIWEVEDGGEGK